MATVASAWVDKVTERRDLIRRRGVVFIRKIASCGDRGFQQNLFFTDKSNINDADKEVFEGNNINDTKNVDIYETHQILKDI